MIKHLRNLSVVLLFMMCQSAFSKSGPLFKVFATGTAAQVKISLCLNGKRKTANCETTTVSALTLSILTTIPNHLYSYAGIEILTPGYALSNCALQENGQCLFSVSNKKAASILLTPKTCQADVISFSPTVTAVNNPIGNTRKEPQKFIIHMTMCNSKGQPLIPSETNPVHIHVYGAPDGVISPTEASTSTGSVTFVYNGQYFPNNISINAWIGDSSNKGYALGVTQVLQQNTPPCTYGKNSYQVPLTQTLPGPLQIKADVGYDISSPLPNETFTIDTGSLGVIVPEDKLGPDAIGPGAPGVKLYNSSGDVFHGYYYLAPVRILAESNNVVQTIPIMVLAVDKTTPLYYLGVGFNRNSTTAGDLFDSPTANAFLHITNATNGTNLSPGYYITPNDANTLGLALGINTNKDYNVIKLTPNPNVPGDFNPQSGCYSFPDLTPPQRFCGTALLDVGINEMFIDLPRAEWPAGSYIPGTNKVPPGTQMSILMGAQNAPSMQYSFPSPASEIAAAPSSVTWIDTTKTGSVFVNTGRNPLFLYDYFYDGQCGQVGFKRLP